MAIDGLEGKDGIGGDPGEEARVRITVRIDGLFAIPELSKRNLAENAQALHRMDEKSAATVISAMAVGGR